MKKFNLKKLALGLLLVGGVTFAANAQTFQKGNILVNAGAKFASGITPIGGAIEYGFTDQLSGGVDAFFGKVSGTNVSTTWLGARVSYHFDAGVENLDLYAGPRVGYYMSKVSVMGFTASANAVDYGAQAGGRYFFAKNIGVYGEAGYGGNGAGFGFGAGLALKF